MTRLLAELFDDDSLTKKIATQFPEIDRVIVQMTLDSATPENQALVGPEILALKKVREVFSALRDKGNAVHEVASNSRKTKS